MAVRKVSHHRRIISKTPTNISNIGFGDVIQFQYISDDIYDRRPMVFVLKKVGKFLNAINIGYMKEYKVQRLLEEQNPKKLKHYSLYKDSFRTYKIDKMTLLKMVEYKTDAMIEQEKEIKRDENKL